MDEVEMTRKCIDYQQKHKKHNDKNTAEMTLTLPETGC